MVDLSDSEAPPVDTVRAAALVELGAVGRESTALGATALALAERIDSRVDTGAALASLAKQLQATLEAATAGTAKAVSPLDELRLHREKRLSA